MGVKEEENGREDDANTVEIVFHPQSGEGGRGGGEPPSHKNVSRTPHSISRASTHILERLDFPPPPPPPKKKKIKMKPKHFFSN